MACHIYAAAEGGPRGTGGLTFKQRQEVGNGIWLCAHHGRLVDTNQGDGYPAALLHTWGRVHEAYLRAEMRGATISTGLITEITIRKGPAALKARTIELSVLNLVQGHNESGKSVLLELLASATQYGRARSRNWMGDLAAEIRWFDPQPHTLKIKAHDGRLRFDLDARHGAIVTEPYRTVVPRYPDCGRGTILDLAAALSIDVSTFIDILAEVPSRVRGEVQDVEIVGGRPIVHLASLRQPIKSDDSPCTSQALDILLEVAIEMAQIHAEEGPTLLLVDELLDSFHPSRAFRMFELLAKRTTGFQAVVVTHLTLPSEIERDWSNQFLVRASS